MRLTVWAVLLLMFGCSATDANNPLGQGGPAGADPSVNQSTQGQAEPLECILDCVAQCRSTGVANRSCGGVSCTSWMCDAACGTPNRSNEDDWCCHLKHAPE